MMKHIFALALLAMLTITACAPAPTALPATSVTSLSTATPAPTATFTNTPPPTFTPSPVPSPTPTATPIPTFTSTPVPSPTPTATPIPTIQVGGLSVPDPRATNPELFDLSDPDAPIPQFVNAMRMAGIEATPEQVDQGITYQVLNDKDGKPFIVGVYHLDPDPNKKGETLEGPIPLVIATQDEKGEWRWEEAVPSKLAILKNIFIGNMSHPTLSELFHNLKKEGFNSIITITDVWSNREKSEGKENMSYIDKEIEEAIALGAKVIRVAHLLDDSIPSWVKDKKPGEAEKIMLDHIEKHMRYIYRMCQSKGVEITIEFNVTNEIWNSSLPSTTFGSRDRAILLAVQKAISVRNDLQRENKGTANIKIELGLSQADAHYTGGEGYRQLLEILSMLEKNGIHIDYVDLHGHEKDVSNLPSLNSIKDAITEFRKHTNPSGEPIKVVIGEYDLNIMKWTDNFRYMKQAQRYYEVVKTALEAGVHEFSLWGIADPESWFETDIKEKEYLSPDADALVFDDLGNPKLSYYAMLAAIFSILSTQ